MNCEWLGFFARVVETLSLGGCKRSLTVPEKPAGPRLFVFILKIDHEVSEQIKRKRRRPRFANVWNTCKTIGGLSRRTPTSFTAWCPVREPGQAPPTSTRVHLQRHAQSAAGESLMGHHGARVPSRLIFTSLSPPLRQLSTKSRRKRKNLMIGFLLIMPASKMPLLNPSAPKLL